MKIIVSSIIGLAITSIVIAQTLEKKGDKAPDRIEYIKKETIGGKLDYRSVLSNPDQVVDHKGVRFNKNDYYVFLWGESVGELGIESYDKAAKLWEEIHAHKLTSPQRTALRIGFEKEIK